LGLSVRDDSGGDKKRNEKGEKTKMYILFLKTGVCWPANQIIVQLGYDRYQLARFSMNPHFLCCVVANTGAMQGSPQVLFVLFLVLFFLVATGNHDIPESVSLFCPCGTLLVMYSIR
jgi:hypothetical protein